ncbi:MAG: PH domain-containing protein [Clostridiaceae bacterium]|nr:PH domain-containing protein [Clostridiaceae bacterium]
MKNKKIKEVEKEKVLFITNLHWKTFLDAIVCIVLPFIIIFTNDNRNTGIAAIVMFLLGILLLVQRYMAQKTSEFAITNLRLIIKRGIFKSKSQIALLNRIEGFQLRQGVFGRLINSGSIIIKDKSGAVYKLKDLKKPKEFSKILGEQIK